MSAIGNKATTAPKEFSDRSRWPVKRSSLYVTIGLISGAGLTYLAEPLPGMPAQSNSSTPPNAMKFDSSTSARIALSSETSPLDQFDPFLAIQELRRYCSIPAVEPLQVRLTQDMFSALQSAVAFLSRDLRVREQHIELDVDPEESLEIIFIKVFPNDASMDVWRDLNAMVIDRIVPTFAGFSEPFLAISIE